MELQKWGRNNDYKTELLPMITDEISNKVNFKVSEDKLRVALNPIVEELGYKATARSCAALADAISDYKNK